MGQEKIGNILDEGTLKCLQRMVASEVRLSEFIGWVDEDREIPMSSKELEFLGDAVVYLIVTERLLMDHVKDHAELNRRDLTQIGNNRDRMVSNKFLREATKKIDKRQPLYRLTRKLRSYKSRSTIYAADVFETVVGAMYLVEGYGFAQEFVTICLFGNKEGID